MENTDRDRAWMAEAIKEARLAAAAGEAPIGAVIVRGDKIIARAHNTREAQKNALHHAEILAVDRACAALGGWRLPECTLYVTLEPCPMCAGAAINSRMGRVVFGASDPKAGCAGSVCNLFDMPFNHRPKLASGVCAGECAALLSEFFWKIRKSSKDN